MDWFRRADAEKGKLRSFLLICFKRYATQEHRKDHALKRGNGVAPISLDSEQADERWQNHPADDRSPDALFDRNWAITVLEAVMERLYREYERKGRERYFEILRPHLTPRGHDETYAEAAEALDLSLSSVKVAVHRLRKRYRELLIAYVQDTVTDRSMVDDEIQSLFRALS